MRSDQAREGGPRLSGGGVPSKEALPNKYGEVSRMEHPRLPASICHIKKILKTDYVAKRA